MVAVIAGPKILLLLPCWLAGVAAYRVRSATLEQRHWALALAVVPLLLAALLSHWHFGAALHAGIQHAGSEVPWLGRSNEFLKDYVTSVLVAAHLYGVRYLGIKFPVRLARAIAAGASLTFTLYLLHFPVLLVFKHVLGSRSSSVWSAVLAVLMVALGTWLLGTYTETRRVQLRRLLARYTSPILKPTRPAPV
jgi:hypothetical protein